MVVVVIIITDGQAQREYTEFMSHTIGANARVKDEQRQDDSAMGNPIDARHVELEESLRQDHKVKCTQ